VKKRIFQKKILQKCLNNLQNNCFVVALKDAINEQSANKTPLTAWL